MSTPISEIAVVLPARNEAELLPAALAALETARARFSRKHPQIPVSITVVLDSTTDNSRTLLASYPRLRTVSITAGRVGAARNAGIAQAWALTAVPARRLWIANTDADSEVPPQWIQQQHDLAMRGVHVVAGTVQPRDADVSRENMRRWLAAHQLCEGHPHIHGANLGFRADVFAALGGFKNQGLHEDRDFVTQARVRGYEVLATDTCRVLTSGRLHGRVDGGFADFLARLGQETGSVLAPSSYPAARPLSPAIEAAAGLALDSLTKPPRTQH